MSLWTINIKILNRKVKKKQWVYAVAAPLPRYGNLSSKNRYSAKSSRHYLLDIGVRRGIIRTGRVVKESGFNYAKTSRMLRMSFLSTN